MIVFHSSLTKVNFCINGALRKMEQHLEKPNEKFKYWPYFWPETVLKSAPEYGKLTFRLQDAMWIAYY